MSDEAENGNGSDGSPLKTVLLIVVAVVAGFYGLKLTVWALKMLLWVAAVGAIGYLGYQGVRRLSSKKPSPKMLPKQLPPATEEPVREKPASGDIDRQLEELKRRLEEEDS